MSCLDDGLQGGDAGDLYSHAELLSCGDFPYRTKGASAIRNSAKADLTGPIGRIANGLGVAPRKKGCSRRCKKKIEGGAESKFSILRYRAWRLLRTFVFLFLLGTITSVFAWSLDRACVALQGWRVGLIDAWFKWEATDIAPGANSTAATAALAALQLAAGNVTVAPAPVTSAQTALIVAQVSLFYLPLHFVRLLLAQFDLLPLTYVFVCLPTSRSALSSSASRLRSRCALSRSLHSSRPPRAGAGFLR